MKPEDLGNILIEMGRALTAKPYLRDSAEFAVRNVLLVAILAGAQACHAMTPPDDGEEEWIEHDGSIYMDVPLNTPVIALRRDGTLVREMGIGGNAGPNQTRWYWKWAKERLGIDVVKYRIVKLEQVG